MLRSIMFIALLSATFLLEAKENVNMWLDLNGASIHTDADTYYWDGKEQEYNGINYGIGATFEWDEGNENFSGPEVSLGFFDNSYNKLSFYATATVKYDIADQSKWIVAPGIKLGAITGYDDTPDEGQSFILTPMVALGYGSVRTNIHYLPSKLVGGKTDVIMFQLSLRMF